MSNSDRGPSLNVEPIEIETDVLVIGGGIAGTFAALRAKERGLDVTLVDKGTVGKSGLSPWFTGFAVYDPSSGAGREDFVDAVAQCEEFLTNRPYIEMWMDDGCDRYEELVSWGAFEGGKQGHGPRFREQLKKNGVRLVERTMIVELIEKDGRVGGAVGFPMEKDQAVVIQARAVILCSGAGAFKTPGFPIGPLTHDGDAMAYKLGAEITGKEFTDYHFTHYENPAYFWGNYGAGDWESPLHKVSARIVSRPALDMSLRAHEADVPLTMGPPPPGGPPGGRPPGPPPGGAHGRGKMPGVRDPKLPLVIGATAGMAPHKCEGIFPQNDRCETGVPGLYAAGDALCTSGAVYGIGGYSSSGSAVQGSRAGTYAAEYVLETGTSLASKGQVSEIIERIFSPRAREQGYSPAWVTQVLQGLMVPYYVLCVKRKDRLKAALTNVEFLRDHFVPQLLAKDTHGLRLAHETAHMVLNAEMKLRASLFRTESRGSHYRQGYPARDDADWLAWVKIKHENGNMKVFKEPIPEAWRPAESSVYKSRYPHRFPGELEFLHARTNR